jgi:hypothetical protein
MVGDGYAMGVAVQILEHVLGAAEWWFGVDDPRFSKQWPAPGGKGPRLSEWSQIAGKVQLPSLKSRLETGDELPAKYAPEHVDGEKESRVRPNPVCAIEGEPTRRDANLTGNSETSGLRKTRTGDPGLVAGDLPK